MMQLLNALAESLTSAANPLLPRVMVNRIWKHHFGEGLVRTVDNFGQMGERPTHPELLDYLAARLELLALLHQFAVSALHQLARVVHLFAGAAELQ